MIYSQHALTNDDGGHIWAVVKETCNVSDVADAMLLHAAEVIRLAYGEDEIRQIAEGAPLIRLPEPADELSQSFDLSLLLSAFRSSLPDPEQEGKKPAQLTNYRSETTELIARAALNAVFGFAVPPALHATKGNRNQPILGFDGWTVMKMPDGGLALVLMQVKGTDDTRRPPPEVARLLAECGRAISDYQKLKGFLCACIVRCKGTEYAMPLAIMVAELEKTDKIANTVLAPVVIRGKVEADLEDLEPLRSSTHSYLHAKARGMTLSIGADLTEFGRAAMARARQNG